MATFQGSPEEFARMVREAMVGSPFKPFYETSNETFSTINSYPDIPRLIRCSDGVYRPERKPSPMSGMWGFGSIRRDGGGFYTTTGN